MGKIIVLISTTPDGFAESQHVIIDPEFFEFTHLLLSVSEAVVFGRKTFEQFQAMWPKRLKDENSPGWVKKMAQSLHDIQKIVFSSSLKSSTWNNAKIMRKLESDSIQAFRINGKGGILTFGSLSIIESLTEMNLVDDYYFNIQPLIAGGGEARLFSKKHPGMLRQLTYVDHKHLNSGAHIIHYQRRDVDQKGA